MFFNLHAAQVYPKFFYFVILSSFILSGFSVKAQKVDNPHSNEDKKFELTYIDGYPVVFIDTEEGNDVRFDFSFNVGGVADEKLHGGRLAGLSHFLEHTLTTSSIKFPYEEQKIFETLHQIGKGVNASTGRFGTDYYWIGSEENAPRAMEIYSDLIFNPEFNSNAIETERSAIQDEKTSYLEDKNVAAYYARNRVIYEENSPYRNDIIGTTESIAAIHRIDLIRHWNQFYNSDNAVILVSGNFSDSPAIKINLKEILEKSIRNSKSNLFYNDNIRQEAKNLISKLTSMKPEYRDSKFKKILVEGSDNLSELSLRLTLELDPNKVKISPFTLTNLDYLLTLESPENPIYLLKEKGISTLPSFYVELEGNELNFDVSMTILNKEIAQELEREDQSVLNFFSETILARIMQISEGVISDPYHRFVNNLIANDLERIRSQNLQLSSTFRNYQSLIGNYQLTWENLVENYNQFYSNDPGKALDSSSREDIAKLLAAPIRNKSFKMHWFLVSKQLGEAGKESTPYKGVSIVSNPEAWAMESQSFAELDYSKISKGLQDYISEQKESHLASELLNLTFKNNPDPSLNLTSSNSFVLNQNGSLTVIKQGAKILPKHQNIVIRFSNEAEDELSYANLQMFLTSFKREYSKELTIVQSYLTSLFINTKYIDGKQVLDFSFIGEPEAIAELAPRVLFWLKQHHATEKSASEVKKIYSNAINSTITGNVWDLAFQGLRIKSQNFEGSLEAVRYYVSDAHTIEAKALNKSKRIFDGSEVIISLVGSFSEFQLKKITEGAIRIIVANSELAVSEGVKKRRAFYENFDLLNKSHIKNSLPDNVSSENAVVVLSSVQVNPNIHAHSYFMSQILAKMLHQNVFAINREENNLGYYHNARFDVNQDGLHMMFAGKVETAEDPISIKNMLQRNWREAAERILRNEKGASLRDFNTIRQALIFELTSRPKMMNQAFRNLNSWSDFRMSDELFREEALKALKKASFERDILPLVKELLPEHSNSNRLTYMIGGGCEHIFRDRIRD